MSEERSTNQRLISWTLCGSGRAEEALGALQSIYPITNLTIVVDTSSDGSEGESFPAGTVANIAMVPARIARRPWTDFGTARNDALQVSEEHGADWSCMLDSDERVVCPDPAALRAYLATIPTSVCVVLAHDVHGSHTRERFFRHPNPGKFRGRVHETFIRNGDAVIIPREIIHWTELPKNQEQLAEKWRRDERALRSDLEDDPKNSAAWYYLGATLQSLGRHEEAIEAWRTQSNLDTIEGGAWSCFKAGESYLELGKHDRAVDAALAGMARDAGIAELPWLAALASLRAHRWEQALNWAQMAKVHAMGSEAERRRVGFRVLRGITIGPDEVIAFARDRMAVEKVEFIECSGKTYDAQPGVIELARMITRDPIHITVTSTALNAGESAWRCVRSVCDQTFGNWSMRYVACDQKTAEIAGYGGNPAFGVDRDLDVEIRRPAGCPPLLANLLPIWRSLPPDEVIVWLDGDDWLATDEALAHVARAHAAGAWVTYGSFMYANGRMGFAGQCGPDPRSEMWRATHLKSFRAGLVQRVRDVDWRMPEQYVTELGIPFRGSTYADSPYLDVAIDQAVMLPCLEMAGMDRSKFIPEILCVYNHAHSFEANANSEEKARERQAVQLIRSRPRYARLGAL